MQRPSSQKDKNKLIEDTKAKLSLDDLFTQIQGWKCERAADHCKGRRTGIGRGSKAESCEALQRGGTW